MAFNGNYANPSARRDCNVRTKSVDPLTSLTLCYKNEFFWLNHTWNHEYMDAPTSYELAASEIGKNTLLALKLGLVTKKYGIQSLVTGDVSGLGWYAPGGPDTGPKVDHGLEASNRDFSRLPATSACATSPRTCRPNRTSRWTAGVAGSPIP